MSEVKTNVSYYRMRDTGSSFYDIGQGAGVSGKVPGILKKSAKVNAARSGGAIVEISKEEYDRLMKEHGPKAAPAKAAEPAKETGNGSNEAADAAKVMEQALEAKAIVFINGKGYHINGEPVAKSKKELAEYVEKNVEAVQALTAKAKLAEDLNDDEALLKAALTTGVVTKDEEKGYSFLDMPVAKSEEEALAFLGAKDNEDIRAEIVKAVTEKL